ncbi:MULTISPECIES: ArsR/SmtB family transcription factor [Lonsdalea]|uniref:Transcriptional regulator n=2 Tax=Lonsdalea TaxID=1082702 RepID=A0ACD1JF07_9GAMM|nr:MULTISPECIES: helix-turn-helix transcriptional regulator [Lonsdalea]OSM97159.1 transcriptional regulator [Lonsdalea populi]OSN02304.1 transcriptional regulator [Lonsdalea populi]QPQ22917.1 helix-turn-helix transcriptional regulator [Lonsdalea populi]RAT14202.1 transcriptional regulator [Lonsdalea quercina]RAT17067.1 transcriptional regulator [Lonsdalea quercina]
MGLNEALKAFSHPTRRAILVWLKDPDTAFADDTQLYDYQQYGVCASLIQKKAGLSQPATSLCLKSLQALGVIEATKVGIWTYYKRNESRISAIMTALTDELGVGVPHDGPTC